MMAAFWPCLGRIFLFRKKCGQKSVAMFGYQRLGYHLHILHLHCNWLPHLDWYILSMFVGSSPLSGERPHDKQVKISDHPWIRGTQ